MRQREKFSNSNLSFLACVHNQSWLQHRDPCSQCMDRRQHHYWGHSQSYVQQNGVVRTKSPLKLCDLYGQKCNNVRNLLPWLEMKIIFWFIIFIHFACKFQRYDICVMHTEWYFFKNKCRLQRVCWTDGVFESTKIREDVNVNWKLDSLNLHFHWIGLHTPGISRM